MSRWLIILGIILILLGLAWPLIQKIGLGRLPGDLVVNKPNLKFYFPLTTSLILSLILTGLIWLIQKFFR